MLTVGNLLGMVIERTGYRQYLTDSFPADGEERWENVQELRNVAAQFDELGKRSHLFFQAADKVASATDQGSVALGERAVERRERGFDIGGIDGDLGAAAGELAEECGDKNVSHTLKIET